MKLELNIGMCGLIGIIGQQNVVPRILSSLELLQYRGYDSYGIAVVNEELRIHKELGAIKNNNVKLSGNIGIGHTRWATHGKVSLANTHPIHNQNIAVAQNGIIKNFINIKSMFPDYKFIGETDTETILPLLLDQNITSEYLYNTMHLLEGSYAILILNALKDEIYFMVRGTSPLLLGITQDQKLIASDIKLFNDFDQIIDLQDGHFGILSQTSYEIYPGTTKIISLSHKSEHVAPVKIKNTWFETEFFAQPTVLRHAFQTQIEMPNYKASNISLVGCGSAYFASCIGEYWLRNLADVDAKSYIGPELPPKNSLVIAISQSGETADLLNALKRSSADHIIAILNNVNSSAAKYVDFIIPILAKTEISVASTKATTAQMLALLRYALHLAPVISDEEILHMFDMMDHIIQTKLSQIEEIAKKYYRKQNLIIIARNILFPIACECALKIKELAYIHAESIPSSELKHGPLALIDENSVVICFAPGPDTIVEEIKARNGQVVIFTQDSTNFQGDYVIEMPKVHDLLLPFLYILPAQWLAYSLARERGNEIDRPRNLAKSVTVE